MVGLFFQQKILFNKDNLFKSTEHSILQQNKINEVVESYILYLAMF
jgi:hypothetical protein